MLIYKENIPERVRIGDKVLVVFTAACAFSRNHPLYTGKLWKEVQESDYNYKGSVHDGSALTDSFCRKYQNRYGEPCLSYYLTRSEKGKKLRDWLLKKNQIGNINYHGVLLVEEKTAENIINLALTLPVFNFSSDKPILSFKGDVVDHERNERLLHPKKGFGVMPEVIYG